MKIECEIRDINHDEVVHAMASRLLQRWSSSEGEDGGEPSELGKQLGRAVGRAVNARIEQIAVSLVREAFDTAIVERIAAAVDAVLAEGWRKTNSYGDAVGDRVDLKGRISEVILEKKSEGYQGAKYTLAESLVRERVTEVMDRDLKAEVEKAKASLRAQLDAAVTAKFVETLKQALGVR
jgi:hypothetical protein